MHLRLLFVISIFWVPVSVADSNSTMPDTIKSSVVKQLKSLDTDIPIEKIEESPLRGLYTVTIKGGHILYSSADGKYIIRGDMLEINNGSISNLTANIRNKAVAQQLSTLNANDMITFSPTGKTRGIVYAFTDVDCGYCRKLHQEIPALNEWGVELRYLAFPRGGRQAPAYKKMVSAWCADDKKTAMTDLKSGKNIQDKTCKHPIEAQMALGEKLGISGTPALFLEDGTSIPGYRPAIDIVRMMNTAPATTASE